MYTQPNVHATTSDDLIIKGFPKIFLFFFHFAICHGVRFWFTTQRKIKSSKWGSSWRNKNKTRFSPLLRYSVVGFSYFSSLSLFRCYFYISSYVVVVVRENFPVFNEYFFDSNDFRHFCGALNWIFNIFSTKLW